MLSESYPVCVARDSLGSGLGVCAWGLGGECVWQGSGSLLLTVSVGVCGGLGQVYDDRKPGSVRKEVRELRGGGTAWGPKGKGGRSEGMGVSRSRL